MITVAKTRLPEAPNGGLLSGTCICAFALFRIFLRKANFMSSVTTDISLFAFIELHSQCAPLMLSVWHPGVFLLFW